MHVRYSSPLSLCLTTQHVSGMRIFREMKLCARARSVPRLDGLDLISDVGVEIGGALATGVDGVETFCCCDGGLVSFGKLG